MKEQDELYNEIINIYNAGEIDLHSIDDEGDTLAHIAVLNGSLELIKFLHEKGLDLSIKNNSFSSPLELALQYGEKEISLYLINLGLKLDKSDGSTLLHIASKSNNTDLIEYILKEKSDLTKKDESGWTPIFWAVQEENIETVDFLLSKGSDINRKDNLGISLLDIASSNGSIELVQLLLNKGANVNSKRNDGTTALHMAAAFGHTEVVKLLLEFNADTSCVDSDENKTALDYANENGHKEIQLLLGGNGTE